MLIGFNNDVEYRGMTFHIQTEDRGEVDCQIETQLFHSGAILDTLITSYVDTIQGYSGKAAEERIRAQMKASHRSLFKKLRAGEYDSMVGLEPMSVSDSVDLDADAEDFNPSQERVPLAAQQLEEGGEEAMRAYEERLAENKKEVSHFSLDRLKDQLSALKQPGSSAAGTQGLGESSSEEDPALATQILDSSGFGLEFSSASHADASAPDAHRPTEVLQFAKSGVLAWSGCKSSPEDLSLTELVEAFLAI